MSSRYDRRDSTRNHRREHEDDPEDYRAEIELTDLPAVLTEDPEIGIRFIHHYFTKVTHFAIEDVHVVTNRTPEGRTRALEAGEIDGPSKPRYRMTLTERSAWERLRGASDPPASRRGGAKDDGESLIRIIPNAELTLNSSCLADPNTLWEHDFLSRYMPSWSNITKVQGGGKVTSISARLFARKVRFRLARLTVTTELPATSARAAERSNEPPATRPHTARRVSPPPPPISSPREALRASPIPYAPFGSPRAIRPISWDMDVPDADDGRAYGPAPPQANTGRTATQRDDDRRRPEYRLTEDYVGHAEHDESTDPWLTRQRNLAATPAEENIKWLERHRKYLLATEVGVKLPTTIPAFPRYRTIVTWHLAKFMTRKHIALFFSQFGRVDDVKIRQIPEGWSPAGRIAYVAFMKEEDCSNILRKLNGINFPKHVESLRETKKYWMVYDDFNRFAPGYLLVAEAVEGRWCPVASKLVDGKLDPAVAGMPGYRPMKSLPRPRPEAARPIAARSDRSGDALDYSSFDSSRRTRSRSRARSEPSRPEIKITLPVIFPEQYVPVNGEKSNGGARGEGHRQLKVLAVPPQANAEQLGKLLRDYGSLAKTKLASYRDDVTIVQFNTDASVERAAQKSLRTTVGGKYANCFELTVSLRDLKPEDETIWSNWNWKHDIAKIQADGARQQTVPDTDPITSSSARPLAGANAQEDVNDTALTIDELDNYLENGVPSPPLSALPPPPPSMPVPVPERPSSATSTRTVPTKAVQPDTTASARPSMQSRRGRGGGAGMGALALLMANQPDILQPEKRSIEPPEVEATGASKKQRFE